MAETCETVIVQTKNGPVRVNKEDAHKWGSVDIKIEFDGDTIDEESISDLAKKVSKPKRKYTRRNKD